MKAGVHVCCDGVEVLVGWPPFEQLERTPFALAGWRIVRYVSLGGVTVSVW